jgi:phage terminase small subunit
MAGTANSGRRPTPTAVKIANGNPGKRPLNTSEPVPPAGIITRPAWLQPAAVDVWDRLSPIAEKMGTLTTADVEPFAVLCALLADFHVNRNAKVAGIIKGYFAEFGFTPASRSRIVASLPNPENEFSDFGF